MKSMHPFKSYSAESQGTHQTWKHKQDQGKLNCVIVAYAESKCPEQSAHPCSMFMAFALQY